MPLGLPSPHPYPGPKAVSAPRVPSSSGNESLGAEFGVSTHQLSETSIWLALAQEIIFAPCLDSMIFSVEQPQRNKTIKQVCEITL